VQFLLRWQYTATGLPDKYFGDSWNFNLPDSFPQNLVAISVGAASLINLKFIFG
jgi:hypothetical protein